MKKTLTAFALCAALSAPAGAVSLTDPIDMDQTTIDMANALLEACLTHIVDGSDMGSIPTTFNTGSTGAPVLACRSLCETGSKGGAVYEGPGGAATVGAEMPSWAELIR